MTVKDRWDRVSAAIEADAGIGVSVDSRSYPGGVSFSITHRLPSGDVLRVIDQWSRKNDAVWVGYAVWVERDGIVRREWPLTKRRGDVAAAVCEALALVGGAA